MGILERKERQRAELREQILAAAREIVDREGFEALTMRKIGEAIEYSPGTIYLHFANRDEIAQQLVREGFLALLAFFSDAASERDPLERLRKIGRRYVDFAVEQPATYRLIFLEDPRYSSAMAAPMDKSPDEPGGQAISFLLDTIVELVETGTFRPVDPDVTAHLFWGSLHGLVALELLCPNEMLPGGLYGLAETMGETLVRGLLA